jgi:hypothetical protein
MSSGSYSIKQGKGRSAGTRLVVTLRNAPFLRGQDLNAAEPQAREIALVARAAMRDPSKAPGIDVVLVSQTGIGVTFANRHLYRFTAEELAAAQGERTPSSP